MAAIANLLTQRLRSPYWRDPVAWIEVFCLANLSFLSLDILIAHSVNDFRRPQEYIPLVFSLLTPFLLGSAILAWLASAMTLGGRRSASLSGGSPWASA